MILQNLSKGYNSGNAIHNLSFELKGGTVYGLIGPNGSGKTTLLKCMAGIYRPDEGSLTLDEQPIYDNAEAKRRIAYIDDTPVFYTFYTVRQQALYYGSFYEDFSETTFEQLAESFCLNLFGNAEKLSLGQRKKLCLSLALSRTPDYLLLDEPENGLDNEARIVLRKALREAADRGVCIVLSSHDLNNIEGLCDELLFLQDGTMIYQDSIDALFASVHKWTVQSQARSFSKAIVADASGDVLQVITWGDRESCRDRLEQEGAKILSAEKTTLSDAYLLYKEVGIHETN